MVCIVCKVCLVHVSRNWIIFLEMPTMDVLKIDHFLGIVFCLHPEGVGWVGYVQYVWVSLVFDLETDFCAETPRYSLLSVIS